MRVGALSFEIDTREGGLHLAHLLALLGPHGPGAVRDEPWAAAWSAAKAAFLVLPLQPLFLALAALVLVVGGPTGARAALTILPVMVVGFGIPGRRSACVAQPTSSARPAPLIPRPECRKAVARGRGYRAREIAYGGGSRSMCGIAGLWVPEPAARVTEAELLSLRDALRHRGPDAEGVMVDGPCGLVHTRLAVIDLSPRGRQPMTSAMGDSS